MTYDSDCTLPDELSAQITEQGFEILPELIRTMINAAMQIERQNHLGGGPYERSPARRDYVNGFKPKTVATRVGKFTFDAPQVRDSSFYPQSLEKGLRSERALKLALAEMYVQGVSTRKVAAITEQLCGFTVSSTQVSQATALLDEQLEGWRRRPLGRTRYLWLDAHYEKVRQDGQVRDGAALKAVGLNEAGQRQVLGVSVSLGEQEVHWRAFLQHLVAGVVLVVSDAHAGLQQARRAVFGGVPWQRCQFHLQQNAQAHVPRHSLKAQAAADIRAVFNAPSRHEADALLARLVQRYGPQAAKLANWMETNITGEIPVVTVHIREVTGSSPFVPTLLMP